MTAPAEAAKVPPPQLSESILQELVSDYYLAQIAQTRIDYIDEHKAAFVTLPFCYEDGSRIEIDVSEGVGGGVLRLCDLDAVNASLGCLYDLYPAEHVDCLKCRIQALCEPEGVVLDSVEGLVLYTRPGQYVDALHRFITTLVRVDALFRGFKSERTPSAKGAAK